jgi:hypothetical protein
MEDKEPKSLQELADEYNKKHGFDDAIGTLLYHLGLESTKHILREAKGRKIWVKSDPHKLDYIEFGYIEEDGTKTRL